MSHSQNFREWSAVVWIASLLATLLLMLSGWYLWPRPVQLSTEGYEIATALYRICNQQEQTLLGALQAELDTLKNDADIREPELVYLQQIIDLAKSGEWESAMRAARDAMNDQVQR